MFTGIVEESGAITAVSRRATACGSPSRAAGGVGCRARRLDLGQRRLPHRRRPGRGLVHRRRHGADARHVDARRTSRRATTSTSSARPVGDRLGGHIVQGHVDGTGELLEVRRGAQWRVLRFSPPRRTSRRSWSTRARSRVAGVSLTVSAVSDATPGRRALVRGILIPETLEATTLGGLAAGDRVNLETDVLARHVQRMLSFGAGRTRAPRGAHSAAPRTKEARDEPCHDPGGPRRAARRPPVIVADDENRENEGDVILSAELATPEWIAWTVRWSSGFICAPMPAASPTGSTCRRWSRVNEDARGTAYTVSVDAADRISTGISAADRAHTLNVLADPTSTPTSVIRPGHVLPLRAVDGGVRERGGHTEAAVDLMRLAGLDARRRDRRDRRRGRHR